MIKRINQLLLFVGASLAGVGCVKNDVPYPTVYGNFVRFEVRDQLKAAAIDTVKRTVTVYLPDHADLRRVQVTACELTDWNIPQLNVTLDPGLSVGDELDLTTPNNFVISTFQHYAWTISAEQTIQRNFVVENQIGTAQIDVGDKSVLIFVPESQRLDRIKVIEAQLGPSIAETSPNPLTVTDFTHTQRFTVSYLDITEEWSVQIMQTSVLVTTNAADAWATRAYLHGSGQVGETFGFKLRKRSEATWITLDPASITVTGGEFSAQYTGLEPDTEYVYVAISGANQGEEVTFRTEEALPLPNGSLDQWHQNGKVWNPWPDGGTSFFDTGNRGATTVGESNTQPSDELPAGITAGKSAKLESKWIAVKFAAGNLFAGEYLRTDGTNGVLAFGRPFTSRPVKLRGKYRYEPKPITRYSTSNPDLSHLQNLPDSCHIYIALSDASQPLEIRTKLSERQTFSPSAPDILAFAELVSGSSTGGQFVDFTLELDYRATNRVPKYIMVVGSSSKYGDYFTGGEGSLLYLDQFELLYE